MSYKNIIGVNIMAMFLDEEKKLKELTGDIELNSRLKKLLEDAGISPEYAHHIQKTLENEIKHSKLDVNDIEPRLNYLISQLSTITNEDDIKNIVEITSPSQRTLKYIINQSHNVRPCPECGAEFLKTDRYCYKCGLKLDNPVDELSDLEALYSKKISHTTDNKLKYAYVTYLDYLYKNKPSDTHLKIYNVSLNKLETKAHKDNYIASIECMNIRQLREILKKNHLKVSGTKDELIERIRGSSCDSVLSKEGISYLNKNRHVIFYNMHPELKDVINIDIYENLFEEKTVKSRKEIIATLIEYLKKQETITLSNYEVDKYRSILLLMARYYESIKKVNLALEAYLEIFMLDLNSFCEDSKQAHPEKCRLDGDVTERLTEILDRNSIDINTLKRLMASAYESVSKLSPKISANDTLIYLLRIFNGEKISDVERSIHLKYSS